MTETLVLISNMAALPDTFGSSVVNSENDSHRVQEYSWKLTSHYQQASNAGRSSSFPPIIGITLLHQFGKLADQEMIHCQLIDEGDVFKDVLEDCNLLDTEAKPAVIVCSGETELIFTDFKRISAGSDRDFQSADLALGIVLSTELLSLTPETIRTTVKICIPILPPCSSFTRREPQSVYDNVFENPLIMDRIITYVVGFNVRPTDARTRDIKSITAVNKCWRASYCRVLELFGAFSRTMSPEVLNKTIQSFSGGFPLHTVIPYQLVIHGVNQIFSGRVLRFLARYPATALTCYYDEDFMEELHHIVQFSRLKTLRINARFNLGVLQDIQRMLNNSPILRRLEIIATAGDWIPCQDNGLILPESLKFLWMEIPICMMTVVSDRNHCKKVKHLCLNLITEQDDGSDKSFEMEDDFRDEHLEAGNDADDMRFEIEVDENNQANVAVELMVGQDQHIQRDGNDDLRDDDKNNHLSMLDLAGAQICTMLKTMGPSLVSLDLLLNDGPLNNQGVLLPDLPKLNSLVVDSDQIHFPANLPSLECIHLNRDPMEFRKLFTEGRTFEWVTELSIFDGITAASVAKISSALPNCSKISVVIIDDAYEGQNDVKGAATLGEIFYKLPRLRFLEVTCITDDNQFLDLVFTGLSLQEISTLKQSTESWGNVFLGPRSIANLYYLQTLVIEVDGKLEIEVSDFLFRIAFMKMNTLTNVQLYGGLTAGGEIAEQWKKMGRELCHSVRSIQINNSTTKTVMPVHA